MDTQERIVLVGPGAVLKVRHSSVKGHGNLNLKESVGWARRALTDEVLRIYTEQLGDLALAEAYCKRTHDAVPGVYLLLVETMLQGAAGHSIVTPGTGTGAGPGAGATDEAGAAAAAAAAAEAAQLSPALKAVVELAERNFDKLDPVSFLDLLPPSVPLTHLVRYLSIVIEYNNTKKRNLQVSRRGDGGGDGGDASLRLTHRWGKTSRGDRERGQNGNDNY